MIKIYGKNCVYEAIKANSKIKELYILDTIIRKDKNILDILDKKGYKYTLVNKSKMDSLFPDGNQGYGAIRDDYFIYDESYIKELSNSSRVLLLDGIQDPHNLGAIIRSVDAFGYDFIILPKNRSAFINQTVAHVSTGAIEHVKIGYVNSLLSAVKELKDLGYWIVSTDASGNTLSENIDKSLKLAIIIGSEGFGISKTLLNQSDFILSIPMVGHVNSLNASVSTGIILKDLMKG